MILREKDLDALIFHIRSIKSRASAAATIQSFFKMTTVRKQFKAQLQQATSAAINIQRVMRGRLARREHPSRTTVLERSAIIIQRAYRFHRLQRVALEMKLRHPGWRKFAFQSFHLPLVEKALCRSWELTGSHRATESNDALVVSPLKIEVLRSNLWGLPPGTPRSSSLVASGPAPKRRQSGFPPLHRRAIRSPRGALFRLRPGTRSLTHLLSLHKMRLRSRLDDGAFQSGAPFLESVHRKLFVKMEEKRAFLQTLRDAYEIKRQHLFLLEVRNPWVASFFFQQLQVLSPHETLVWSHVEHIQRIAASVSIQASWRAWKALVSLPNPLLHSVIAHRAAVCIQRWWRGARGRMRVRLLDHARDMFGLFMDSPFAVLPMVCYREAMELEGRGSHSLRARVPEQAFSVGFSRSTSVPPVTTPKPTPKSRQLKEEGLCVLSSQQATQELQPWLANTLKMQFPPREGVEVFYWKSHRLTSILRWGSRMRVVTSALVAQAMTQDEDFRLYMEFMGGVQEVLLFQYPSPASVWFRNLAFGLLSHTTFSNVVFYMIDSPVVRREAAASVIQRAWHRRCVRRNRRVTRLRRRHKLGIPEAEALLDAALEHGEWISDPEEDEEHQGDGDSGDDMPQEWPRTAADMLRQATMLVEARRRQKSRFERRIRAQRSQRRGEANSVDPQEVREERRRAAMLARTKQQTREQCRMLAMLTPRRDGKEESTRLRERSAVDSAVRPQSAPGTSLRDRRTLPSGVEESHPRSCATVCAATGGDGLGIASSVGQEWCSDHRVALSGVEERQGSPRHVVELPQLVFVQRPPTANSAERLTTREEIHQLRITRGASSVREESVHLAALAEHKRVQERVELQNRIQMQKARHQEARQMLERMKASSTAHLRKEQQQDRELRRHRAQELYQEMVLDRTARLREERQHQKREFLKKLGLERAERTGQNRGDREALQRALDMRAMADHELVRAKRRAGHSRGVPVPPVLPPSASGPSDQGVEGTVQEGLQSARSLPPVSARRRGGGGAVNLDDPATDFMRQHNMISRHTRTGELVRKRVMEEQQVKQQVEDRKRDNLHRRAQMTELLQQENERRRTQVAVSNELRKQMLKRKKQEEEERIRRAREKGGGGGSFRRPRFSQPRGAQSSAEDPKEEEGSALPKNVSREETRAQAPLSVVEFSTSRGFSGPSMVQHQPAGNSRNALRQSTSRSGLRSGDSWKRSMEISGVLSSWSPSP